MGKCQLFGVLKTPNLTLNPYVLVSEGLVDQMPNVDRNNI